jgi:hypothetical protein
VSVWAARCPQCGHGCEDAIEDVDGPTSPHAAVLSREPEVLPASTGEPGWPRLPSPKNRRLRLRVAAGALVCLAAIGAAILATPDHHSSTPPTTSAWVRVLKGTIVAQAVDGAPLTAAPDGGRPHRYPALRLPADEPQLIAAPDGRFLAGSAGVLYPASVGYGTIFTISGTALQRDVRAHLEDLGSVVLAQPSPFADHDGAVVVLSSGLPRSQSTASMIVLADGQMLPLGLADAAAGDPRSLGAFLSVPVSGGTASPAGRPAASADGRIELQDRGRPPIILATSGELNQDVGQPSSAPVDMTVYPDDQGDKVAVLLNPLGGTSPNMAMVILDRAGQVLATVAESTGPAAGAQPSWSPDGQRLAYPTATGGGPAIAIRQLAGQTQTIPVGDRSASLESCIWSPAATIVLCLDQGVGHAVWDFADTLTGAVHTGPSLGVPLVWLPALTP